MGTMSISPDDLGPRLGLGRTAEVFALDEKRVVKLFLADFDQEKAAQEAERTRLVHAAGLPAPQVYHAQILDGRFAVVLERLDGTTMLAASLQAPWRMPAMIRVLAELHNEIAKATVPGLPSFADLQRRQIDAAPVLTAAQKDRLQDHLGKLPATEPRLCHGDFHPDNVLMTARGPVIIDWLTAAMGDPVADLARTVLLLQIGQPAGEIPAWRRLLTALGRHYFCSSYKSHYRRLSGIDQAAIEAWMPIVAAARLTENVTGEQPALLARLERFFAPA